MDAQFFYESNVNALKNTLQKLQKKQSFFGIIRLGNILAIAILFYVLWSVSVFLVCSLSIVLVVVFVLLIHKDLANRALIKHTQQLLTINENELLALQGNFTQYNNGFEFIPKTHFYANDMDVFGAASLFQFLNRTTSEPGAKILASWLSAPTTTEIIMQRQVAVKELATKMPWVQQLQATGKETSIKNDTISQLKSWLQQPFLFIQFKHWHWLRWLLPAIICSATTLYIADVLPEKTWYIFLFVYAVIGFQINKVVAPLHNQLSALVNDLDVLSNSIAQIENHQFTSPLLTYLHSQLKQQQTVSTHIKKLKKILDRLDLRYNIVIAIPLNILLLWNLQQVLNLEKWKKQHNNDVEKWFSILAEFEALNSFANILFNNPKWCFATITAKHFNIDATALGHPLIQQSKRVNNEIHINNAGEIMIVTGSNMAGKSTYLRSIGINTILTMAGAPCCASSFTISPVQLISSMRIADNLEESTSTFYAELKKLQTVIEKINAGEKIFILLDEILRGTNSLDRHTGSAALVKQLIKKKAAAILATHDVELAAMQTQYPNNILNYHFDAQVSGEELYFDYKLKDGVCTNINASILMKKIGLEVG